MTQKKKTLMSWSSGKDSAWALYQLQQDDSIDLAGLFCTVNREFSRVAMHGVRLELLHQQAERIGLPLEVIEIPFPCTNADYERIMGEFVVRAQKDNIDCFAFGDLFLEDIRNYRIERLEDTGIEPIFPIWGIPTDRLAQDMIASGLKAVTTCIDPKQTPPELAGQFFDNTFLDALTETMDPCGENGEFHTCVIDGPMFKEKIDIRVGEIVERDGFIFADVLPVESEVT